MLTKKITIWYLAALALGIGLLNPKCLSAQIVPKQFAPVEMFQIGWGNGSGQVGLLKVPGENYGPQSFYVDEGASKVYILDSTNQRIMVYDLTGTLLSFIPISEGADDLCMGNGGNLYVLYTTERSVVEYNSIGSVISTYPLIDAKSPVIAIHFDTEQGLFFVTADENSYPLLKKGVKGSLTDQVKGKTIGAARNNNYFFLERKNPSEGSIRILDSEGKVKMEIPVKKNEQRIDTLTFIGIDNGKNLYVETEEPTSSSELKRYIREYDLNGALLAEALIPYSNYVYTLKDLRVGGSGKIYQLLPLRENVKVLAWGLGITSSTLSGESFQELFSYPTKRPEDFMPGFPITIPAEKSEIQTQVLSQTNPISQAQIMSVAEAYKSHPFSVGKENITTGTDASLTQFCGKEVITCTPIRGSACSPGSYTGIPYKWGGFTGITGVTQYSDTGCNGEGVLFFDEGLAEGAFAGDVNCTGDFGSCCAVGVDCTGLVSQAWGLSRKYGNDLACHDLQPGTSCVSCALPLQENVIPGDILFKYVPPPACRPCTVGFLPPPKWNVRGI